MPSYRWTVPASHVAQIDETIPGRVHSFLTGKGLKVDGVTVENMVETQTTEGPIRIAGPFIRVESDADPAPVFDGFQWDRPVDPDQQTLITFLDLVSRGRPVPQNAMIPVVAALSRLVLNHKT